MPPHQAPLRAEAGAQRASSDGYSAAPAEFDLQAPKTQGVTPLRHVEVPAEPGQNRIPNQTPFTPWHFSEFATGDVAKCFGADFDIFRGYFPPRTPAGDLQLITRAVAVNGRRGELKVPASCTTEYDVPADAWYYAMNSHPAVIPYAAIMEIALQSCCFLTAHVGSTLPFPAKELRFRNLDGAGTLLADFDLRGKTVANQVSLTKTSRAGALVIQMFTFHLSVEGQPFYEGNTTFGYFPLEQLTSPVGLDAGREVRPWHLVNRVPMEQVAHLDLTTPTTNMPWSRLDKPCYRLPSDRLHLTDVVECVDHGGSHAKGYVYAERTIDADDWFFPFHFHQDPVMPGSLGIESMIEAMHLWALRNDLGRKFKNPRFNHRLGTTEWKYRGQIDPRDAYMSIELHVADVLEQNGRVVIVGDGNLFKNRLRIYEVKNLAVCLEEADDS